VQRACETGDARRMPAFRTPALPVVAAEQIALRVIVLRAASQEMLRENLPLLRVQVKQMKLTGVVRADGRDRHDVHVVYSLNFSLARAGSFPADVPLTFSNKNGLLVSKCNKEKLTGVKNFCDKRGRKRFCLVLTLHKQGERGGETVQEAFFSDRPDLAIAKETGEAERPKLLLRQAGVVIRHAEEIFPSPIAAAQATTIDGCAVGILFGALEQFAHVLAGRVGIAPLKLHRLAGTRHRAHGKNSRIRIAADELAYQEIATMKILKVFVNDQADKQVAAGLLLVRRRKFLERLGQHRIRRAVRDLMD
jgi:hypothetical protein